MDQKKTPQAWLKDVTISIPDLPYFWVFGRYKFPKVYESLLRRLKRYGIMGLGIEHHTGARRVFSTGRLGEYYFPELPYISVHGFNRPHNERLLSVGQKIVHNGFFRPVQKLLRDDGGNTLNMLAGMIREAKRRGCSLLVIHTNDLSAIHSALVNDDMTSTSNVDASVRECPFPDASLVILRPTLEYLQKLGEAHNMRWAIENVVPPRYKPTFSVYENPVSFAQMVEGYSRIGVTIDTAHLMIAQQLLLNAGLNGRLPKASETVCQVLNLGKLWNLHCIGYGFAKFDPYEGPAVHVSEEQDEFRKIFRLLYEYGYDGQIVLELSRLRKGDGLGSFIVACLRSFCRGPRYEEEMQRHVMDVAMIADAVGATQSNKK